jgi:hypothetical protein
MSTAGSGGTGAAGRDASAGGGDGIGGARADASTNPDGRHDGGAGAGPRPDGGVDGRFSFFVVSMKALQTLSGNPRGFGGNLTFGQADGLAGADEICRRAAEMGMPGAGRKTWRAFLSVVKGPNGMPVHARDRIGPGPWYDRNGRLVAASLADLFAGSRPKGDPLIVDDLPNERGEPNSKVGPGGYRPTGDFDNHDTITGSDRMGRLRAANVADTCNDWTSASVQGHPYVGHSWPRRGTPSGQEWASDHVTESCVPGLDATLGGSDDELTIGVTGGYGGFYCFSTPDR